MNKNFKEFIEFRDTLFLRMMEAAQDEVASSLIEDDSHIIAALLAAHIACVNFTIDQLSPEARSRWALEFIKGAQKTLITSREKYVNSLH